MIHPVVQAQDLSYPQSFSYPILSHFTLRGPNSRSSQFFVFVAIYSATITVPITTVSHLGSCSGLPSGIATSGLYSNSLSILQSLPKANWIMLVSSLLLIHCHSQFFGMAYRASASTSPNSSTKPLSTLYSVAWTSWISLRTWKTQSFFWPLSFYTPCSFSLGCTFLPLLLTPQINSYFSFLLIFWSWLRHHVPAEASLDLLGLS